MTKKKLATTSGSIAPDKRGIHKPANKFSDEKEEEIRVHINSFPVYESHYTRERSSQRYLHSDLTLQKMHKLYTESRSAAVSYTKYAQIFHTMNIKFKKPKSDRCNKCEILKLKIDSAEDENEKSMHKKKQEEHHTEADIAYKSKDKDKCCAKEDSLFKVVTFDLQKCLPTPFLETSVSFYKRLLWTYNLTVHDCTSNKPMCLMWHEVVAKRGGNELASCLLQYLKSIRNNCKHLTLYSDSCAGQNKNAFVATMFTIFMQSANTFETIEHKFLVPGHTHMECDVDHSLIERKKKRTHVPIHHPRDWFQFVGSVGSKNVFQVKEMKHNLFLNFSPILKEKFLWRKVNENGEVFKWSTVKWLKYTKNFGLIYYKNSLSENEPFKILNIKKRGVNTVKIEDLQPCYHKPLNISSAKKKDLLEMIHLIDINYHEFYKNLPTEDKPDYHPDLLDESEDEE